MTVAMGRYYLPPQVLVLVCVLAAVGAILLVLARPASGSEQPAEKDVASAPAGQAVPVAGATLVSTVEPLAEPAPAQDAAPAADPGFAVVRPASRKGIVVRARPGGRVVARLGARTEFGSPTTLGVVKTRGPWLGVVTTHLPNGRLGWVDRTETRLALSRTRVSITVDLSARRLVVRRADRVLRRVTVAVGRPSSPTPTGRFAVTDKLSGSRFSAAYGCCILALSAHQPNLPAGWPGGDRIAVHGTNDPGSIGTAASAGCPRATDADLRYLLRTVPLGAPVVVRA
jgi:lipoprotein-anchoring transpeptidase ErfK/SrfK